MRKNNSPIPRSDARQSVGTAPTHRLATVATMRVGAALLALLLAPAATALGDEAGMLRLGNQQFASGTIDDSPNGRALLWNHPAFTEPFQFPIPSVVSVSFPVADQPPAAQGQFGLQLVGGGLLYGDVVGVDDQTIRLKTDTFGELSLRRQSVQRLFRWRSGEDRLYVGPRDLSDWRAAPTDAWSDAGSVLASSHAGAAVVGDVRLPAQCAIDVKVGWDDTPNFQLSFGVDADAENALEDFSGFQIEVWGDELVLLRELENTANVASIGTVDSVPGYVQLTVLLDQANHRVMVLGADGRVAADLVLADDVDGEPSIGVGMGFENIRGGSRLESLSVRAGSPEMFDAADQTDTLVWLDNDKSFKGRLQSSQDGGRTLLFSSGDETRSVPANQVVGIVMQPLQAVAENTPAAEDPAEDQADLVDDARLSVYTRRGMRLVGRLQKVEQQQMWLTVEELAEPISIAIADIRDFVVLDNQTVEAREQESRVGRLETSDTILQGAFEDGQFEGPASCFVFAPALADNASPLRRDAVAEMIYRDAVVVNVQAASQKRTVFRGAGMEMAMAAVNGQVVIVDGVQKVISPAKQEQKKADPSKRTLHLRAGDTVECEVLSIDDIGIKVRCKGDIEALVPHAQIRAVELESLSGSPVADERRQRLLTVPRMRRDNPPTHLIVSVDGDYLRGRLESMDADGLRIETRLATQEIARSYVAQIIWLHGDEIRKADGSLAADEAPDAATPEAPELPADAIYEGMVQVVRGDGTRLSFVAEQVQAGIITGTNEFLGPCSQDIANVDRLVFGRQILSQGDNLPFASWRLTHAPDPMVFRDSGSGSPGGGPSGKSSELVGQDAPDFELRLLSGENYRLSDHQGDVIVLDFWASWCGPCMQAMPNVDEMIHEFDNSGVQLIAVNLQESEQRIQQALERLKLDTVVAMDTTGDIAERYQASSIPQTVVIDRQGKITHLFVGGGARTLEQLRTAITEALK